MVSFEYTLKDPMGLHARPAGLLVMNFKNCDEEITINFGSKTADAKRMMAVMRLGASGGDVLEFTVSGPNEEATARELKQFLESNI